METQDIDHVGVVVENLEEAIKFYEEKLGMKCVYNDVLKDRGLKVAFLKGKEGETAVELLEPVDHNDMNNTVAKFLKNKGQGMHHLAVRVSDISASLKDLEGKGISLIDKSPRPGAMGHTVAFVHPKSVMGLLLELVQH
ncbi:methylmalonyl-CoA epimerase [Sulfuracidifex tepidarius]|uniref:Methylmalonyl-CoA epimerase n=1 Tax=Sulfuracidifex tepidarius TaxID=1294262 RepID=A0A510DYG0_9CREN|nr:methylmalonyl-CoA epimerase [Sulfuracidifex tepidarius]BBG25266.1 Methylmalonyl-CoA epimerase [Sulfuracidifex tepidarius]BBG28060.1 Methylmalonyl-CoA epimerase [Sulfuracidifex tepidarius]